MLKYETKMAENPDSPEYSGIVDEYASGPEQVRFLNETQMVLSKAYSQDHSVVFNATHFVGSAFISFKYQHYRDHIIDQYEANK